MKAFPFGAFLMILLITACDKHDGSDFCHQEIQNIDFDHPQPGQKNLYLGFYAPDYSIYTSDTMQFTQDTLVMEIIGEDAFGLRIREYYTQGSIALSNPDESTDTVFYSMILDNESMKFDWDLNSGVSPRGRLFDYGVRYTMHPEPYVFDKLNWKVFPSLNMPQFGVTGVVESYQPLEDNFGACKVWYDVGTVFAHIERPTWIYQSQYGLIARYTEITSGSYARGFILILCP